MSITLPPLQPQEEARIVAAAEARASRPELSSGKPSTKFWRRRPRSRSSQKNRRTGSWPNMVRAPAKKRSMRTPGDVPRIRERFPMIAGVADTHTALWYLFKNPSLGLSMGLHK